MKMNSATQTQSNSFQQEKNRVIEKEILVSLHKEK